MQTVQSSVLVLYTSLLTASTTNRYGTANVNFTDVTFSNISMRQVLGSNYDKYYKFNLILNSIMIPTSPTDIPNGNDGAVMLYMSGIPFDSSACYSTITNTTTNSTLFGTVKLDIRGATTGTSDIATFAPSFFNTFLRPTNDIIDISIALRSAVATFTGAVPSFLFSPVNIYPRFVYSFSITPVLDTALLPFPSREEQSLVDRQRMFTK
jgi:hypothetical protein